MTYQTPFRLRLPLLILLLGLWGAVQLGGWQTAAAQDAGDATATPVEEAITDTTAGTVAADTVVTGTVTANEVNEVARQLWCPLCSGVRLDACELKACTQMKDVIGEKLAEGEDAAAIKDYFVAYYGPQVLGEPPLEGFNWLAWVLPVLALVAGGLFVGTRVRNSMRRTQSMSAEAPAPTDGDAYSRKLDEELKHYD
jgi:cytochrome c-type biogenesis protein CcmH